MRPILGYVRGPFLIRRSGCAVPTGGLPGKGVVFLFTQIKPVGDDFSRATFVLIEVALKEVLRCLCAAASNGAVVDAIEDTGIDVIQPENLRDGTDGSLRSAALACSKDGTGIAGPAESFKAFSLRSTLAVLFEIMQPCKVARLVEKAALFDKDDGAAPGGSPIVKSQRDITTEAEKLLHAWVFDVVTDFNDDGSGGREAEADEEKEREPTATTASGACLEPRFRPGFTGLASLRRFALGCLFSGSFSGCSGHRYS